MNKNKLHFLLVLLVVFLYASCDRRDGDWDDSIKLSTKKAIFSAQGDSITIKTGGSWWWINNITLNNNAIWYSLPELADSTQYTINLDSFIVERRDNKTLFVKAMKNNLNTQRKIQICLEAGDYFDYVIITQNGQ